MTNGSQLKAEASDKLKLITRAPENSHMNPTEPLDCSTDPSLLLLICKLLSAKMYLYCFLLSIFKKQILYFKLFFEKKKKTENVIHCSNWSEVINRPHQLRKKPLSILMHENTQMQKRKA